MNLYVREQESAYEYYNFGQRGFEHGESSNCFNESVFVDYDDDEALARSLMMMDVNDYQFSPHNTRSNVTESSIGVHSLVLLNYMINLINS